MYVLNFGFHEGPHVANPRRHGFIAQMSPKPADSTTHLEAVTAAGGLWLHISFVRLDDDNAIKSVGMSSSYDSVGSGTGVGAYRRWFG